VKDSIHTLLVADSPVDAQVLRLCLQQVLPETKIDHAATFAEATVLLGRESVDLVLLDWAMPDVSGPQALAYLNNRFPRVPVIVLVSAGEQKIGRRALESGARDWLCKGEFGLDLFERAVGHSVQWIRLDRLREAEAKKALKYEGIFREAEELMGFGTWKMELLSQDMEWSDSLYRLLETERKEGTLHFSDYLQRIHPEDRDRFARSVAKACNEGGAHQISYRVVAPDGRTKPFFSYLSLNADWSPGKFYLLGLAQDGSERISSEYLWMARRLLQSSGKLQKEMLSNMSFRLRTPLGTLANLLYLFERTPMNESQSVLFNTMRASAYELTAAASSLLNLSLMDTDEVSVEKAPFNLLDCVRSAWKAQSLKLGNRKIVLRERFDKALPERVTGDAHKLFQILYNLFDQTLSLLSAKGGTVQLQLRTELRTAYQVRLLLEIADSGGYSLDAETVAGWLSEETMAKGAISEEDIRQLNIPVARMLVGAMGGELKVEYREAQGLSVGVWLPFGVPSQQIPLATPFPENFLALSILLVEDHVLNQIAAKKVLVSWQEGVEVDIADNGRSALEKMALQSYDVVLMDLQMPIMDGMEAFAAIRQTSSVPVIAVTANASPQEETKCLEAGFNAYLSKPYKPQQLYEMISRVLRPNP
jgi:CheY-like chemotaxis protein